MPDKNEAMEAARQQAYERFWDDFGAKGHKVSDKMVEQLFDAGHAAASESAGWVDVKERLPEPQKIFQTAAHQQSILVSTDTGRVFETVFTTLGFSNCNGKRVLAWMPLPEPYTEDR